MDSSRPVIVNFVLRPDVRSKTLPEAVAAVVEEFGGAATQQFQGTDDPNLSSYWLATTTAEHAPELASQLLGLPLVDGAYIKPAEEPA
jgi:hypothetical protein